MNKPIYTFVLEELAARKGEWPVIARESGVSYSTLCKVAQRHMKTPSVQIVQKLYDYLHASREAA